MTLTTRLVRVTLTDAGGAAVADASIRAGLTAYEVDGTIIVPRLIYGKTDINGTCLLHLWPNERGTSASQYRITAVKFSDLLLSTAITIPIGDPATEVLLQTVINAAPYPQVDAAQQAVIDAQALVDTATTLKEQTQAYHDTVVAMADAINAVDADLANINAVAADLTALDAIALALTALNAVAAALTSINATALHLDNVDAVGGSISNVNAVGAAITHVQAVSGALTAVNAVALDLTPINAVALALAAINSVAGDLSAINSLAGDLVAVNAVNINASNINTVAGAATSVTAVAGAISAVNAVSAALTAINSVSAALTAIGTVSTNIASVNTVSGVAANVTTVAGISDNVTTVAGISGNVTTVAGISANVTSVAGIAAAVSTNAANITAIQNAAANASSAGTSATNAANSYIAFANRFLGAKSSAPTLDNYGGALITGALYWDTTLTSIRAWSGSAWLDPLSNMVTETDARILGDQQLLEAIIFANDIAGQAAVAATTATTTANTATANVTSEIDNRTLYDQQLLEAAMFATDLAGQNTKSINGGTLYPGPGSAAAPSVQAFGDKTAGVFFPATGSLGIVGNVATGTDNTQTLGTAAKRWSTVYAGTGTINTSDGREKTAIQTFNPSEIAAAIALSKEVGTYQFLESVAIKGNAARHHIGLTVQRAIEVMQEHGLEPFRYGFICHDSWPLITVDHPAKDAVEATLNDAGEVVTQAMDAIPAWTEVVQEAGDRYAFRYDQLNLFISAGLNARLQSLEQ